MAPSSLPAMVSPAVLDPLLGGGEVAVVDLSRPETRAEASVPGARPLDYATLVASRPPVGGLMPDEVSLGAALGGAGIGPGTAVVAYDDEGGGKAGRLLFTLDALGHEGPAAMLDGGIRAWVADGRRSEPCAGPVAAPVPYPARYTGAAVADGAWILARLDDPGVCLLDTRTEAEFTGANPRAARGGHIPGAVSFDWVRAMDPARERRLRPEEELRAELEALGVTPDREVVAYCHTHHRSSHTYWVLRALGYERVRGYPGAWSEWGNDPAKPVEA